MFAQLYRDHPELLERLLEGLTDGVNIDIGIDMQQQTGAPSSVPDGSLQQSSFKVVIETKTSKELSVDQLRRHVEAFDGEEQRILLLLTPESDDADVHTASSLIEEENGDIIFAAVTFSDIVGLLIGDDGLISSHDQELYELVDDYQNFCSEENLLPDDDVLRAVPCGDSHADNDKFDLYYAPASRSYRSHQFVGIYYRKSIRHIGRLDQAIAVDRVDGELEIKSSGASALKDDERRRIQGAMDAATKYGYNIETGHKFFLVEKF